MKTNNNQQLQVRIDAKTKKEAKIILDELGLDMSTAIKLFLKQMINAHNLPFEIRGENGLSLHKAELLREAMVSAKNNNKTFSSGRELIKDALAD